MKITLALINKTKIYTYTYHKAQSKTELSTDSFG